MLSWTLPTTTCFPRGKVQLERSHYQGFEILRTTTWSGRHTRPSVAICIINAEHARNLQCSFSTDTDVIRAINDHLRNTNKAIAA